MSSAITDSIGSLESHQTPRKQLCLFCFKNVNVQTNSKNQTRTENVQEIIEKFTKLLVRFLEQGILKSDGIMGQIFSNENIDCCENCLGTIRSFCDEFHQLNCLQLKLQWRVEKLVMTMKLANRVPSRVQQLRRVLGDHCDLRGDGKSSDEKYECFKRFRHEMIRKCKRKLSRCQPRVLLKRSLNDTSSSASSSLPNGNSGFDWNAPALEIFLGWIFSFTAVALIASVPSVNPSRFVSTSDKRVHDKIPIESGSLYFDKDDENDRDNENCDDNGNFTINSSERYNTSDDDMIPPVNQNIEENTRPGIAHISLSSLPRRGNCDAQSLEVDNHECDTASVSGNETSHPVKNEVSASPRYQFRAKRKISYVQMEQDAIGDDGDNPVDDFEPKFNAYDTLSSSSHSDSCSDVELAASESRVEKLKCDICVKTFSKDSGLKRHNKLYHQQDQQSTSKDEKQQRKKHKTALLACSDINCTDKFTTSEELECHKNLHGTFQCEACDTVKDYAPALSIHETGHVTKISGQGAAGKWNCYRCRTAFLSKPSYINHHMKEHLGISNSLYRTCSICGADGMEEYFVRLHHRSHHKTDGLDPSKIHKCDHHDQCNAYFIEESQLVMHKIKAHSDGKCPECVRTFSDSVFLLRHIRQSHPESESLQLLPFQCDLGNCAQKFPTKKELSYHKRKYKHTAVHQKPSEGQQKCDQCDRYFDKGDTLLIHKIHKHSGGKCSECGKTFLKTELLARHMKIIHASCFTNLSMIPCTFPDCKKMFHFQSRLKKHLKGVHQWKEEQSIKCPKCDREFRGEYKVKQHMERVHKDRSFICSECGKAFKSKSYLDIHMKYHQGPDAWKFQCGTCGRKFADKPKLDQHARTHSKEKAFICQFCGSQYAHRHNWRIHMKTKHKDEYVEKGRATSKETI